MDNFSCSEKSDMHPLSHAVLTIVPVYLISHYTQSVLDITFYRPSLRLYHPGLSLRNSRIKTSKRDQALSATSQCERRRYQRRHNARGDVIELAFVKRKTVLARGKKTINRTINI